VKFIQNVKESQDTVAMVNASTDLKATINQAVKRMDEMAITMREVNKSLSIPLMERIRKNFLG
jgi:5-enolpyruvylshikimate-3-phosphate synthase